MTRVLRWLKRLNYRHYLAVAITLGFVAIAVFRFPYAFTRLWESVRDFGLSFAYYFDELFNNGGKLCNMHKQIYAIFQQ